MFKFKIEPYIQKPVRNPFSSDQVVRTMKPPKAIAPSMIELDDIFYKQITAEQKDK